VERRKITQEAENMSKEQVGAGNASCMTDPLSGRTLCQNIGHEPNKSESERALKNHPGPTETCASGEKKYGSKSLGRK